MSILDIDFTNYSRLQASRMTVTSRSALRAKIEHEMQVYLQAGGKITTLPCCPKPSARSRPPQTHTATAPKPCTGGAPARRGARSACATRWASTTAN